MFGGVCLLFMCVFISYVITSKPVIGPPTLYVYIWPKCMITGGDCYVRSKMGMTGRCLATSPSGDADPHQVQNRTVKGDKGEIFKILVSQKK